MILWLISLLWILTSCPFQLVLGHWSHAAKTTHPVGRNGMLA
jgi:hypothetical protein